MRWTALDMQTSAIYPPCGAPVVLSVVTLDGQEYYKSCNSTDQITNTKSPNYMACLVFDIPFTMETQNFTPYLYEIN